MKANTFRRPDNAARETDVRCKGGAVKKGVFIDRSAEPAVLVRLVLLAADEITGEPTPIGSFLKKIPRPPDLASPGMTLALEIFGERRVFHPTDILWDDTHHTCIVEIAWMASDAARSFETVKADAVPVAAGS
jgi:hypothetical protein